MFFCAGATALRGPDLRLPHLDVVAEADLHVHPLEPVKPDDPEPLVLRVRRERDGGRAPLAEDLDDAALSEPQLVEGVLADAGGTLADVGILRAGDLEADGIGGGRNGCVGHVRVERGDRKRGVE